MEMGGESGRGGTRVPVFVPVVAEIQVEYTEWSHTLSVLLQYQMEYITIMLWPFAAKCSEVRMNNLTIDLNGETPDMKCASTKAVNV